MDNTLKGESTEESKEGSKDKMENTWKGQIKKGCRLQRKGIYRCMDVSDISGGRLVVVEVKFVTENCAVSMTAIYWCRPVFVVSFSLFTHLFFKYSYSPQGGS